MMSEEQVQEKELEAISNEEIEFEDDVEMETLEEIQEEVQEEKKEVKEKKEAFYNEEAIQIEKNKSGEEVDEEAFVAPSFFIEEDETQDVEVDILSNKTTGKIVSISRAGLVDLTEFDFLHLTTEKFTFTIPNYDEMVRYRQQCTEFNREANKNIINNTQMRSYYLVWHLRDWTLKDKKGKKVELEHEETGAMSDDSIRKVYSMPASMLDVILTIFEKDVLVN